MSVASSNALLEVPMIGEEVVDCASFVTAARVGGRLEMPRRRQNAAMEDSEERVSPIGMEPSARMSVRRDCSERCLSRWGSGGTMGNSRL